MKRALSTQWRSAFSEGGGRFAWSEGGMEAKDWVRLSEDEDGNGVLESSFSGNFRRGTWAVKGDDDDVVVMTFGRAHHHCRLQPDATSFVVEDKYNRETNCKMRCRVQGWPDAGSNCNAPSESTSGIHGEAIQVLLSCTNFRPRPVQNTRLYEHAVHYEQAKRFQTTLEVTQEDSLVAAKRLSHLVNARNDMRPLVLNMANHDHPGGGFLKGKDGQEEELCRRSTLYCELCDAKGSYPLTGTRMLITPEVVVFRGSGPCSPELPLPEHFHVAVISAAAPFRPEVSADGSEYQNGADKEHMMDKIRALLSISADAGYSHLVLSAWGCGAYRNPPKQVAALFREALHAMGNIFEHVVFAIADRTTHRGTEDNYTEFQNTFKDLMSKAHASDDSGQEIGYVGTCQLEQPRVCEWNAQEMK